MEEKKLRKSPLVIALYVISALLLAYTCYLVGSTIAYVFSYYSSYSMSPSFGETAGYVLQAVYQPLVSTVLVFAAAKILNEVRTLNPSYYATEAEIMAAKEAKKAKKTDEEKTVEVATDVAEAEEAVKADVSMKKAELLALAEAKGIEVPSKATKADIVELLNK